MARTDNDIWDLATSVGATATMVAAGRARATAADSPLIEDRFAEPLVRAVGVDFSSRGGLPVNSTPRRSTFPAMPGECSR
jgi:O-methyltransferase involved in polyketide biosynthesis